MEKQISPKTIKLSKADESLIRKLHQSTGIQSFSDLVRLALRKLAEAQTARAG